MTTDFREEFIRFALERDVLRFGEFKTKAGRISPYFFNFGLFNDGAALHRLAGFYAKSIIAAAPDFDMLFGPAYKGIVLAATVAVALDAAGRNVPFAYNRKEAKDHGEGGATVGAPLAGRVLIIDDVISAGTALHESVALIRACGATPCGIAIALDRMERGSSGLSAVQEAEQRLGIPVVSIATFDDLSRYLQSRADLAQNLTALETYRAKYGPSHYANP